MKTKKLLTTLVLSVALFGASSYANAQCWGGRCYGYRNYYYGGCTTNSCATCQGGRCSIPQAKPSVKKETPFDTVCPSCGKKDLPTFVKAMGAKCDCGYDFANEFAPRKTETCQEKRANRRFVRLVDLVNSCRARRGLRPLEIAEDLQKGANKAARHCANIGGLQHTGAPEIIAMNYSNFQGALGQWTQSSGHAALLYNPNFTQCGCYKVRDQYGRVFCAMRFR